MISWPYLMRGHIKMFLIIEKTIISFGGIVISIYLKLDLLIQIKYGKYGKLLAPFLKNANPPDYYIEINQRKSKPN